MTSKNNLHRNEVTLTRGEATSFDPSTRDPALAGGSGSGFRLTGVLEGATGLPMGLHN